MTYQQFWRPLTTVYDQREAQAVARLVVEEHFGLTLVDAFCGQPLPADEALALQQRLLQGEPVQYVLGWAEFCGRRYHVEPGVLIPRPETAEMCRLIASELLTGSAPATILDIGTGSGCIAITLALQLPQATVEGWDVSEQALAIARRNAQQLNAPVSFSQHDILSKTVDYRQWTLIVSNPPYISESERSKMERRVTDHEPRLALFVPDNDPLLFYRAIGKYALQALCPGGQLIVEVNTRYAEATAKLLQDIGLTNVRIDNDQYGRQRFVKAQYL